MIGALNLGLRRRLRPILQTEVAECGLACVAMITSYFGHRVDLHSMRARHSASLRGLDLQQLVNIARTLDLEARPVRLEPEEIRLLRCPAILHWGMNYFVVLERVSGSKLIVCDPAVGRRTVALESANKLFTGVALELWPTIHFRRKSDIRPLEFSAILGKISGFWPAVAQILSFAIALELFGIASPFMVQWVIDDAIVSADRDLVSVLALGILGAALISVGVGFLRSYAVMHLTATLQYQWTGNVFIHLVRLPMAWFEKRHIGDIVSRFGSMQAIQRALTQGLVETVIDGLMSIGTAVVLFLYSPRLATVVMGALLLLGVTRLVRFRTQRESTQAQIVSDAKQQTYFLETVRAILPLKLGACLEDRANRYLALQADTTNASLTVQKLNTAFVAANGTVLAAENALVIWMGAGLVLSHQLTLGMLVAFIAYKQQLLTRGKSLIEQLIAFRMLGLQAERLADIVTSEPEQRRFLGAVGDRSLPSTLEVSNVAFQYAVGERWILQGVNLTIEAGEFVAFVGPSGSGKTTLLKIMLGLLTPQLGELKVGGLSLRSIGLEAFRSRIGAVMQDDQLLTGSIAENIAMFRADLDFERVRAVGAMASIDSDILSMPMGYNTLVGSAGSALSGGQKQRVLLARALYRDPSFLFFDEATSNLDRSTERSVIEAVNKLSMTRIVVTHSMQTMAAAHRIIYVAPNGQISDATERMRMASVAA